ncbi:hypothetical protein ACFFX0_29720 [Citricoccus parietis]|uniref:Uncharacterized protein n=1 Tax=Citricoccus parietis TaxID=592307 RepID=A0ABV5G848_9MICC
MTPRPGPVPGHRPPRGTHRRDRPADLLLPYLRGDLRGGRHGPAVGRFAVRVLLPPDGGAGAGGQRGPEVGRVRQGHAGPQPLCDGAGSRHAGGGALRRHRQRDRPRPDPGQGQQQQLSRARPATPG